MDLRGFDANKVDMTPTEGDFAPLPVGDYLVVIIDSQQRQTKAGTGYYCELTLEVVGEKYKGRKLWDRLNLSNPSAKAVQIAEKTLASICHAVGVPKPSDSAELHGVPLLASVDIEEFGGNTTNRVTGYKRAGAVDEAKKPETANEPVRPWARG
jgi:hypothetical protein